MIIAVMNIKNQLRQYLKIRGISAAQLSRLSGVPKQSISDWLSGTSPRNIDHLKKVADVFNISLDELCFGQTNQLEDRPQETLAIDDLIGDQWISGLFEVRLRRVKRT